MTNEKTACERCGCALALELAGAWVCSFQCTFCSACNSQHFQGCCPNCGGELLPRPRRARRADCASQAKVGPIVCTPICSDEVPIVAPLFDLYRQFYHQASDLALATQFLSERIKQAQSVLILARYADQPLGFTQLFPIYSSVRARSAWLLNDLYVHEQVRRHGVASALLRAAADYASDRGAAWLTLETAHDNQAAQRLYQRLGWRAQWQFQHYQLDLNSLNDPSNPPRSY